ncbi:MAG: PEP-CTERM sorting domain-containing protein [Burkholderiales bacterium]|jgi:hypothetical protein|nr:PEP-CTERM sorting domain-containing protein [Burkholderiales bacterium]
MRVYLERVLRTAAMTAVAALAAVVSPAQAIIYAGAWDPTFGQPFVGSGSPIGYGLGWRGTVDVFVPDSCAFGTGGRDYDASSSCAQGSNVQSASVEFYDVADPLAATKGTVTFSTSSMSIQALHFIDNDLISLATLPSNWDQATWVSPAPPVSPFFSLLFLDPATSDFLRDPLGIFGGDILGVRDEIPPGYFGPLLLSHPTTDFDDIDSLWELIGAIRALGNISISDVESEEGRPRYPNGALFAAAPIDIPEPGSLALMAVALLATIWVVRTRRRA